MRMARDRSSGAGWEHLEQGPDKGRRMMFFMTTLASGTENVISAGELLIISQKTRMENYFIVCTLLTRDYLSGPGIFPDILSFYTGRLMMQGL
jgi:hypothetical protein